jgi:hypothetical protein
MHLQKMQLVKTSKLLYDDLECCINNIPKHNLLIVAGDFNARIGYDSHNNNPKVIGRYTFHTETNTNGSKLVLLCESANLRIIQTKFPQSMERLWT